MLGLERGVLPFTLTLQEEGKGIGTDVSTVQRSILYAWEIIFSDDSTLILENVYIV